MYQIFSVKCNFMRPFIILILPIYLPLICSNSVYNAALYYLTDGMIDFLTTTYTSFQPRMKFQRAER